MTNEAPPCSHGLGTDCFEESPKWAKQAFAYRLLLLITPKPLSRRLHRLLFRFIIPPGMEIPPGIELPPGTIIPPGAEPPDTYEPGDTPPPGVTIPPGTVFPPGWTPEDPPPTGVIIPPGTVFPPGWTPPGPLPPGVIPPGPLPPGTGETGTTPPLYIPPWEPGPLKRPIGGGAPKTVVTSNFYGSTSDGCMRDYGPNWNTVRSSTTGQDLKTTQSNYATAMMGGRSGANYYIWRSWLYMDLSTIPLTATITACILMMTSYSYADSVVCVQEGTQGDPLAASDFDEFTGSHFGTVTWQLGGGGVPAGNWITFNATGLAFLNSKIGGTAKLCLREYTHDYLNSIPAAGPPYYYNGMYFQDSASQSEHPSLYITYEY